MAEATTAIYWDFENIHTCVADVRFGPDWYRANRFKRQEVLVDTNAIMEFVSGYGAVAINRAYNDWQMYGSYRDALLIHALDLIQIYPKGMGSKNGADIRLALDALEDAHRYPDISRFVIVGGDSDYISLAQKLRQSGREVIGIGVDGKTNRYWTQTCNAFKFYHTLLTSLAAAEEAEEDEPVVLRDLDAGKALLIKAVRQLSAQGGEGGAVLKSRLRPMMERLDSEFDPAAYGFQNFDAFIDACGDAVQITKGQYDKLVALRAQAEPSPAPSESPLEIVFRRHGIVLLEAAKHRRLLQCIHAILKALNAPTARVQILAALHGDPKLRAEFSEETLSRSKLSQVFQRLFWSRCLTIEDGSKPVRMTLAVETRSFDELRRRHDRSLISIALRNGIELSAAEWVKLLRGNEGGAKEIEGLIESARGMLQPAD